VARTDIAGYTFQADNWCSECAARSAGWGGSGDPHNYIEIRGVERGFDVFDERTFDSSDWPKAFLKGAVEGPEERCAGCHESLMDCN